MKKIKPCRVCGSVFIPTQQQIDRSLWLCQPCKNMVAAKKRASRPGYRTQAQVREDSKAKYGYRLDRLSKEARAIYNREYRSRNADRLRAFTKTDEQRFKNRARQALARAVAAGKVNMPSACQRCGSSSNRIEAHHHNGYEAMRFFDVEWLCVPCHRRADMEARRITKTQSGGFLNGT